MTSLEANKPTDAIPPRIEGESAPVPPSKAGRGERILQIAVPILAPFGDSFCDRTGIVVGVKLMHHCIDRRNLQNK